ncbi:MAG: SRPBCC domain-containing protein [bacterium]|nr:SRPBCC domain-containing protein [bacterium]
MPVTEFIPDTESLTITVKAEYHAPIERVWQVYSDPRQMERVWGPPSHPATIVEHELAPGGRVHYYMTSPEGERFYGWWSIVAVNEPVEFAFDDGFAPDDSFEPQEGMPVSRNVYRFEEMGGGTRVTAVSSYDSEEALRTVLEMGVEEGTREAMGQIDELLAED